MLDFVVGDKSLPDELLYGRVGYLYALLFVNKYTKEGAVSGNVIRKVVEAILRSGIQLSKKRKELNVPLVYEWHDKNYLGAAHGVAGILYLLLRARCAVTVSELHSLIKPTIDWLINFRYSSGNFFSSVGSESDRLVQWCHGAPGFVHLLTLASQVFKDQSYMNIALECGDAVWNRGLLTKGYSICHGVSGNAYTFLHLYQITGSDIHLYRAACFADWCTKYPKHQGLQPDRPFSLFEGNYVYYILQPLER
ncbi:hypothetical protein AAG570_009475 [Ranatra chinensis]|uniref:LanC-like protein 2 n=1 Tax=Ranatra chinensis TaxID=642074 RepID=A0ABD0YRB6_9HEMI